MRGRATTTRGAPPARRSPHARASVVGLLDDAMAIGRPDAAIEDANGGLTRDGDDGDDLEEDERGEDDAMEPRAGSLEEDVVRRGARGGGRGRGEKRARDGGEEEDGTVFQLPGRAVRSSDENKGRIGARGGVRARRDEDEDEDEEADDEDAPEGWRELCERTFGDKKEARVHVVEWYSRTSASSSKLIVDKWRESRVRYVLRCQRAVPKRQEKADVDACQRIGMRCPLCINITYDKRREVWRVRRSESTPTHDESCVDTVRPNVSSAQFAEALRGIGDVPPSARHEFVLSRLRETGYKISAGTKQRAVALALKRESID